MKVLKKGKKAKPWAGKKTLCDNCGSKIQLEESDNLKLIPDQRDGDYYEFRCPECSSSITVDARLMRNDLG